MRSSVRKSVHARHAKGSAGGAHQTGASRAVRRGPGHRLAAFQFALGFKT